MTEYRAIPFNIHPPPYGREFVRGFEKTVSEEGPEGVKWEVGLIYF